MLAAVALMIPAVNAAAFSLGEGRPPLHGLESVPFWLMMIFSLIVAWLLGCLFGYAFWRLLDNVALGARLAVGLFAAGWVVFVHLYLYELNTSALLGVIVLFLLFLVWLWHSYVSLQSSAAVD